MSLFQSNLRKQIRNLPKILNFVKIIQYYSKLFTGVLRNSAARRGGGPSPGRGLSVALLQEQVPMLQDELLHTLICQGARGESEVHEDAEEQEEHNGADSRSVSYPHLMRIRE